ncbi:MAG: BPL-N domain-containing protein [Chitinophagaceae bacterium]
MKPTIALFLHQPKCSVQSGNGIIKALESHYNFKIFTRHELENDFFDNVDIVAFPGGLGDSDSFDYLFKNNRDSISNFVNNGGRYLGICMGAYWASHHYFNFLEDVEVEQYIKRPNTDTKRPHAKNLAIDWLGKEEKMFFYDGCAFGPGQYEIIAKYKNDDPMAIIQNRIGLIGCHPESQPHWYESYSWMKGHYHDGKQHKLLLNFVDKLMEK